MICENGVSSTAASPLPLLKCSEKIINSVDNRSCTKPSAKVRYWIDS